MDEVRRLLAASMVRLAVADPRHPDARHCLRAYVAELDRRFEEGFDPARSIPVAEADLTPPAGLLVVARAIALYRSAGYREVGTFDDEPYAHHWFTKTLG